jgi:trimeric autotransporter adhesin
MGMVKHVRWVALIASLAMCTLAAASEYHGRVVFSGSPVPGATVTATQGDRKVVSTTDLQGVFWFPDLSDGAWTIAVSMQCFATLKQEVMVGANTQPRAWELELQPLDQIHGQTAPPVANALPAPSQVTSDPPTEATAPAKKENKLAVAPPQAEGEANPLDSDGFLINGSVNNTAASPFAQHAAFGNARNLGQGLYHGGIGFKVENSAFDARPFSLSGQDTPKAAYNRVTGVATVGGPLQISPWFRRGPNFFVSYQWTRDRNEAIQSARVPDLAERQGDFSHALNAQGQPVQIFNPATGLPFPGNMVPVSFQAQALLKLYPLPNVAGNPRYNFQTPLINNIHQDSLQLRLDKTLAHNDQVYGNFGFQSTRADTPNLFGFVDTASALGIASAINWWHRFSTQWSFSVGYRFSRTATRITPFWNNRANISGLAGISGNNQEPVNWGPPTLVFSSGVARLSDAQSSFNRNETNTLSTSFSWNHDRHNLTLGGSFRRQEFNYLSQQDPRGFLTFTGAATQGTAAAGGSDLADFLLGIPDTSAIAFGNADKYFRESVYSAHVTDDWRLGPQLSVSAGLRWEYGAPITELLGRLVNLDIAPGFTAVAPVVATNPVGPLTGQIYPSSLIKPDKRVFEPRLGLAWRPVAGSSLVVRAGYGLYSDTSVYQTLALQMAQQAPLSKSLSVQNSAACPLTLANPFHACSITTPYAYAVDPNFRIGYAQVWQLSLQRDLPGSLQLIVSYLGVKGSRGLQEFLPNTFPLGGTNPCPACPTGFSEVASHGDSTRQAGQLQLRRRLHNGLAASVQYSFSKSVDDDSVLGGQGTPGAAQSAQQNPFATGTLASRGAGSSALMIAQNWRDLGAERGPSSFDQRHLLNGQLQYTTGMGLGGGTLRSGWTGTLFKGWTFLTQITTGSGLPETPVLLVPVPGTGFSGSLRPHVTGLPVHAAPAGLFLNPGAFTAPPPGQFGNAGRNSIVGPAIFTLNGSIGRTFVLENRYSLDFRLDATNLLNKVTFTGWNTVVNSTVFGLPTSANAMRNVLMALNLRF